MPYAFIDDGIITGYSRTRVNGDQIFYEFDSPEMTAFLLSKKVDGVIAELKKTRNSVCGPLAIQGVPHILIALERLIEKEGNGFTYHGYVKYDSVKYDMSEQGALDFIEALRNFAVKISDFCNNCIDIVVGLTEEELDNYDYDLPGGQAWPSPPDPTAYIGV